MNIFWLIPISIILVLKCKYDLKSAKSFYETEKYDSDYESVVRNKYNELLNKGDKIIMNEEIYSSDGLRETTLMKIVNKVKTLILIKEV